MSALFTAINGHDIQAVLDALNSGEDVDSIQLGVNSMQQSVTPLYHAVSTPLEIAELLIMRGADVNSYNKVLDISRMPLHMASAPNAKLLLQHKADVDAQSSSGSTAIHYTVLQDDLDKASVILEYNPDLTIRNSLNLTALELARIRRNSAMIKLLEAHNNACTQSSSSPKGPS